MLKPSELKKCFTEALEESQQISLQWRKKKRSSDNSDRSKLFVTQFCKRINELINPEGDLCNKLAKFDHVKKERKPGEWLLDAIWMKTHPLDRLDNQMPVAIDLSCALECEYSTATNEVYSDFAKLLVIRADIKIFVAGLNHATSDGANKYIEDRRNEMAALIHESSKSANNPPSDWYLVFWPSPENDKGDGRSIWKHLQKSPSKYDNINSIRLYRLKDGEFQSVR